MAPVEFEKELKKRLRSREARPSEDTWDRIADRLDAEGPARRRNPRWWMGLAAASVAFLLALVFFWEQPGPSPGRDPVVEAPEKQMGAPGEKQDTPSDDLVGKPGQVGIALTSEGEGSESSVPVQVPGPEAFQDVTKGEAVASLKEPASGDDLARMEGLARQLDSTYARIAGMEPASQPVDDAQIDSLLWQARQAIARQDSLAEQPSVDPFILLAQAEDELDQTFREKIMEKVKSGVTRLRTAVAQNNK
jgi:hypothetical protein